RLLQPHVNLPIILHMTYPQGTGTGFMKWTSRCASTPEKHRALVRLSTYRGQAMRVAPYVSSPEDSRSSGCVHIAVQSHSAITPTIAEYGVFSTLHKVARLLLYDRSVSRKRVH